MYQRFENTFYEAGWNAALDASNPYPVTTSEAGRWNDGHMDRIKAEAHLCLEGFCGTPDGMRGLYNRLGLIATSEIADIVLIRSHIAYHAGHKEAARARILPSRGHSYRIHGTYTADKIIVRIRDYYNHREGVVGFATPVAA